MSQHRRCETRKIESSIHTYVHNIPRITRITLTTMVTTTDPKFTKAIRSSPHCSREYTAFIGKYSEDIPNTVNIIANPADDVALKIWELHLKVRSNISNIYTTHGLITTDATVDEIWDFYMYLCHNTYKKEHVGFIMSMLKHLNCEEEVKKLEHIVTHGHININHYHMVNYIILYGNTKLKTKLIRMFANYRIKLSYYEYVPEFILYVPSKVVMHAMYWLECNKYTQSDPIIMHVVNRITDLGLWKRVNGGGKRSECLDKLIYICKDKLLREKIEGIMAEKIAAEMINKVVEGIQVRKPFRHTNVSNSSPSLNRLIPTRELLKYTPSSMDEELPTHISTPIPTHISIPTPIPTPIPTNDSIDAQQHIDDIAFELESMCVDNMMDDYLLHFSVYHTAADVDIDEIMGDIIDIPSDVVDSITRDNMLNICN